MGRENLRQVWERKAGGDARGQEDSALWCPVPELRQCGEAARLGSCQPAEGQACRPWRHPLPWCEAASCHHLSSEPHAEGTVQRKRDSGCFLSLWDCLVPTTSEASGRAGGWTEATSVAPSGDICVCPEEEVTHAGVPRGQARAGGVLGRCLTAAPAAAWVFSHIPHGTLMSESPERGSASLGTAEPCSAPARWPSAWRSLQAHIRGCLSRRQKQIYQPGFEVKFDLSYQNVWHVQNKGCGGEHRLRRGRGQR